MEGKVAPDNAQLEYGADTEKVASDAVAGFDTAEVHNGKLYLSEEEAYLRALSKPDDKRPMYIIYAPQDLDNPRNWNIGKKWYITIIASLANVITLVNQACAVCVPM